MSGQGGKAGITVHTGIEAHAGEILVWIEEMPDITLGELAGRLDAVYGLTVAQSTVWRLLDRHGMRFKKKGIIYENPIDMRPWDGWT